MTLLREADPQINRSNIISALKKMEKVGCGKFIKGSKTAESRFEWLVKSRVAGVIASDDSGDSPIIEEGIDFSDDEQDGEKEDNIMSYFFQIRPGFLVSIDLPSDITDIEAKRLGHFIQSLPKDEI